MLSGVVVLHDIKDAEAFVISTIKRSKIRVDRDEYQELVCEGLVILCEMSKRFKPRMAGFEKDGKFSGYAARYLPNKLGDAWHRLHPEHVLKTQDDGARRYEYMDAAASFDQERERNSGRIDNTDRLRLVGDFVSP